MISTDKRIQSKEDLKIYLEYEMKKYGGRKWSDFLMLSEKSILRFHQLVLRKTEYYINTNKKVQSIFYRIILAKIQNRYSLHIPPNCCGKGLKIMHVGPILMNNNVSVGENCSFHMNTALVAKGTNNLAPVLDDGVVVGIGAVVLGGVHIAKDVAIGANSVVNKDVVEFDVTVAGNPARKISDIGRTGWNK